jgi:negative regulator of genetic competence, sporulation and motility
MTVEIVGYEETRAVEMANNELKPGDTRYFLNVKFPDGAVKKMETDKDSVDRYIADRYPAKTRPHGPYSGT